MSYPHDKNFVGHTGDIYCTRCNGSVCIAVVKSLISYPKAVEPDPKNKDCLNPMRGKCICPALKEEPSLEGMKWNREQMDATADKAREVMLKIEERNKPVQMKFAALCPDGASCTGNCTYQSHATTPKHEEVSREDELNPQQDEFRGCPSEPDDENRSKLGQVSEKLDLSVSDGGDWESRFDEKFKPTEYRVGVVYDIAEEIKAFIAKEREEEREEVGKYLHKIYQKEIEEAVQSREQEIWEAVEKLKLLEVSHDETTLMWKQRINRKLDEVIAIIQPKQATS